jgi:hypothetical protein
MSLTNRPCVAPHDRALFPSRRVGPSCMTRRTIGVAQAIPIRAE